MSIRIMSLCCLFSFCSIDSYDRVNEEISQQAIVAEAGNVQLYVPKRPLTFGAVQLSSRSASFFDWNDSDHLASFALMQKVIGVWQNRGVPNYLRMAIVSKDSFSWELVPVPETKWQLWTGLQFMWRATFHSLKLSPSQCADQARALREELELGSLAHSDSKSPGDVFCRDEVIQRQGVLEGREVRVLYNYAPIAPGPEKLHFLITPKEHRSKLADLTPSEYLEVMQFVRELTKHYFDHGFSTAFLLDKSGKAAGQTVFHWHEHLIFTTTKKDEWFSRLIMIKNMVFGSSPLPSHEVQERVQYLRHELYCQP